MVIPLDGEGQDDRLKTDPRFESIDTCREFLSGMVYIDLNGRRTKTDYISSSQSRGISSIPLLNDPPYTMVLREMTNLLNLFCFPFLQNTVLFSSV